MTEQSRILLGINIYHVATLSQTRGTRYPDPVHAASVAELAGADSITIHLREDRRHIQERDVHMLKQTLTTRMNLEMAATAEMIKFALDIKPECCCLVPERRKELTTEGGLDVVSSQSLIKRACSEMGAAGIQVSLFIDADIEQIVAAKKCGSAAIELHTGRYADAEDPASQEEELQRIRAGVEAGQRQGLIVNAGHGLHYHNVADIVAIKGVHELNIGHSIISRAIFVGVDQAVREMRALMDQQVLLHRF